MRLYLDDDSVDRVLVQRLTRTGHDVEIPNDVRMSGESDPVHLTHAAAANRVLPSASHNDFRDLHNLVVQTGGKHPGILLVRHDNDTRRDMSVKAIVRAIDNLLAANVPIENQFIILNHWR